MKKTILLTIIIPVFILYTAAGLRASERGNLTMIITGLRNKNGTVKYALHNSEESYLSRTNAPYRCGTLEINNDEIVYIFKNIPFGEYSITVFQDRNDNNDFDISAFGRPIEPYGLSNNIRGSSGKNFNNTKFSFDRRHMTVKIEVKR